MSSSSRQLIDDAQRLLLRDLGAVRREVEAYPDDDALWRLVPGISNSGGTLALHLAGNLRHFVGAVLGNTGYVRNREEEFSTRGLARSAVAAQVADAEAAVRHALSTLDASRLDEMYPLTIAETRVPTAIFLLHLATHLSYHLGQIDYHRRIVTQSSTTVGTIAIPPLAEPLLTNEQSRAPDVRHA